MARKDIPESRFNTPGPTPGPKGVVKQHHVMAAGYELPSTPCAVHTFQPEGTTGSTHAPGFTSIKKGRRK